MEHGCIQSISTSQGSNTHADHYIATAGAWSRQLLGNHAFKLDIWPVRGQILLFKVQPDLLKQSCCKDRDYFYLIPRRMGIFSRGSTLEEAGFDKVLPPKPRKILLAHAHALVPALTEGPLSAIGQDCARVARQYTCHRSPSFNP